MGIKIISFIFLIFALSPLIYSQENFENSIELTLEESIERALKNNLDIQIARLQLEEVKLELNRVEATFKPKANLAVSPLQWKGELELLDYKPQAGLDISLVSKGGTSYNLSVNQEKGEDEKIKTIFSLNVTQKILPYPRLDPSYLYLEKSLIDLEQKKLWLGEEMDNLKLDVKTGFYNILRQEEELELGQLFLQQAKENLSIVKDKLKQGMANQLDFLDAQMELMAAEEALFRAESTLSQYLAEFKDLLGMGPQKKITLVKKFLPDYQPLRIKLEKACREALENNPQIRQQKLMIKLYQLDLAATKSEISPSLNLSAGYDYNKSGLGEEEYRAALFLEIPLIDGGESKTEIRIAQERVKEAELNLRKLKRDILAEVRSYFFDLKKKEKRIEFLRLSQEKHQESLDIAKKMFLEGAMTEQELREKEISLKQTQIDLLSAIVDYELIRAKLLKIMGRRL